MSFRDNLSHGSSSSPPSQIHRESVCVSVLTGIQQADLETPMAGQKQHKSFSLAHWRPRQLNGHKSGVWVLRTLLYTRLPSHISSRAPHRSSLDQCEHHICIVLLRQYSIGDICATYSLFPPLWLLLGAKCLKTKNHSRVVYRSWKRSVLLKKHPCVRYAKENIKTTIWLLRKVLKT